jgi:hypothetical protein
MFRNRSSASRSSIRSQDVYRPPETVFPDNFSIDVMKMIVQKVGTKIQDFFK